MTTFTSLDSIFPLLEVEEKRCRLVSRLLSHFVDGVNYSDSVCLTGSSFFKSMSPQSLFEPLLPISEEKILEILDQSDYDFALPLDSFLLERFSQTFPSFVEKKNEDQSYGTKRLLKTVYTMTVRDLVKYDPYLFETLIRKQAGYVKKVGDKKTYTIKDLPEHLVLPFLADNFLDRRVELLWVTDLQAVRKIWDNIPPNLFGKFLWKRSPTFIGKEALEQIFTIFETLATRKPAKALTESYAVLEFQGPPVWQEPDPAFALGPEVGQAFAEGGFVQGNVAA